MGQNSQILIKTSKGQIKVELFEKDAPETVENFLKYVDEEFYNGTIFHRVIGNFMIQGGGFTENMKQKETRAPIRNEANNGKTNQIGTLAMARTSDPHSATAQFFINVNDNEFLNFQEESPNGWGYAVFGQVIEGMDTVEKIKNVETTTRQSHENVPEEPVVIESISR